MRNALGGIAFAALLAAGVAHHANAATMTFDSLPPLTTPNTHSENGLTILAISPAPQPTIFDFPHFDVYNNLVGGSPGDNVVGIHTGNLGERVTFTYAGGAQFDLLSIDITGWFVGGADPTNVAAATFTSSAGGMVTVNVNATGIINFDPTFWSNLSSFDFSMPLLNGTNSFTCNSNPDPALNNCTTVGFDDVTFRESVAVPLGAAPPLVSAVFAAGLGAIGWLARRRKAKAAA
jgi:hypothetical protein